MPDSDTLLQRWDTALDQCTREMVEVLVDAIRRHGLPQGNPNFPAWLKQFDEDPRTMAAAFLRRYDENVDAKQREIAQPQPPPPIVLETTPTPWCCRRRVRSSQSPPSTSRT
jgi:hypothetical protein